MHHVTSPATGDAAIEQAIKATGATAPRVTPVDIENNIASEWYFTAADGVAGAYAAGVSEAEQPPLGSASPLKLLTFCVLVLRNGFTVTGESAPVSADTFVREIGRKIARENAVNKIWPLMGYELKSELARPVLSEADARADLNGVPRPTASN